jgi:hypothetical protein
MNQEELENLPYPMFETTEEEKECLRMALGFITEENYNYFLCHILDYEVGEDIACGLKGKVFGSVKKHFTLSDYLGLGHNKDDALHAELRRIWIRKLLAYKPE